jgi:hypothetical protein
MYLKGESCPQIFCTHVDSVLGVFLWHLWGRKEANLLKAFSCQRSPWEATASEGHSGRRVAQSQTQGKGLDLIQVKPFEDLQDQEHSALLLVRHLKRRNPGLNPSKLMGCQGLTWVHYCWDVRYPRLPCKLVGHVQNVWHVVIRLTLSGVFYLLFTVRWPTLIFTFRK